MIEVLIVWIPLCALVGWVGSQKGRSGIGFFFLSFFLSPLIGILVAIALPSLGVTSTSATTSATRTSSGGGWIVCHACPRTRPANSERCPHCGAGKPDPHAGQKKCPACAEWILAEAKKCKHCGEAV